MLGDLYRKFRKIIYDFIINIFASMILTIMLQLLIYPYIAKIYTVDQYGTILVIMGIYNTIVATLGTSLNNIKLISNEKYKKNQIKGDFNLIIIIFIIISLIISYIIFSQKFTLNIVTKICLILSIVFGVIKNYSSVAFRINLNFRNILICNILTAVGYSIGLVIIKFTLVWPLVFALGEIFACFFIWKKTDIFYEPLCRSRLFGETFKNTVILAFTILVSNLLIYLDRLLLLPFLGASNVALYTVASFFGKSIGVLMYPISSVLLSYYSQDNFKMKLRTFCKINSVIVSIGFIFFITSYIISPWVTRLLYPSIINDASPYIILANLAAIISIVNNCIYPSVLKNAPIRWQIIIQIIYGGIYLSLGIILIKYYGLRGFCIATIISNILQFVMLLLVGTIYLKRGKVYEKN